MLLLLVGILDILEVVILLLVCQRIWTTIQAKMHQKKDEAEYARHDRGVGEGLAALLDECFESIEAGVVRWAECYIRFEIEETLLAHAGAEELVFDGLV